MTLTVEAKVGKKFAIYLPQAVVKALNLKEGARLLLRVAGSTVVMESLQDPMQLALSGKKFKTIAPEEIEAISLEEQGTSAKRAA